MSGEYVPPTATLLPEGPFDSLISEVGQRVGWMRSHACPCTFAPTVDFNRISTPGSPQRGCQTCFGIGFYWDPPSAPFRAFISYMHLSPSPDEPGTVMNETFGMVQMSEPSLTIPFANPTLNSNDPAQPTTAWQFASTDDMFVPIDMLSRYTAMLQVGGIQNLPFQQNLQIAPVGAVTVWDPPSKSVVPVTNYSVDGPSVTLFGYPDGTSYMVEFEAAPLYVAFRRAGGLPHIRPFGGGAVNEPKRFRLQTLDLWTRQRGVQLPVQSSMHMMARAQPAVMPLQLPLGARHRPF
jgi:hypothetical protein